MPGRDGKRLMDVRLKVLFPGVCCFPDLTSSSRRGLDRSWFLPRNLMGFWGARNLQRKLESQSGKGPWKKEGRQAAKRCRAVPRWREQGEE